MNGRIDAEISYLKFELARSTPAANAPAVSVSPSILATAPIPAATRSESATNVSDERVAATTSYRRPIMYEPATRTPPKPTVAFAVSLEHAARRDALADDEGEEHEQRRDEEVLQQQDGRRGSPPSRAPPTAAL